jgi:hypothetical protein
MTASETPDELRARLDALAAVATERPWHHGADINRESGDDLLICEPDEIVGAGEWVDELDEGAPGGSYRTFRGPAVANCAVDFTIETMWEANAAFVVALVNAWPAIDALLARLIAAEKERDEALIAINGGCGCPAPFDTCPHDEPLLPALNDARARIAELTAPLEPNDSLLERAKEVVKVGGLYGLSDGTVDLIAELAARCEQLTALRGCSQ